MRKQLSILLFLILVIARQAIGSESHVRVRILEKYHPKTVRISYAKSIYEFEDVTLKSSFPVRFEQETLYTLSLPEIGFKRCYKGSLTLMKRDNELLVINRVPLETYVASVVISEMGQAAPEAMCAQAVIARTWAIAHLDKSDPYDFNDLTSSQSYQGHSAYVEKSLSVISKTEGEILTYGGRIAKILYHAQCSDRLFSAHEIWGKSKIPYLVSTPLPPEAHKGSDPERWTIKIPKKRVDEILFAHGARSNGHSYAVEKRDGVLVVDTGNAAMGIDAFRLALNRELGWNTLRSNDFKIRQKGRYLVFSGKGFGHLVGLCQEGAETLAESGWRYSRILALFYPGTALVNKDR